MAIAVFLVAIVLMAGALVWRSGARSRTCTSDSARSVPHGGRQIPPFAPGLGGPAL